MQPMRLAAALAAAVLPLTVQPVFGQEEPIFRAKKGEALLVSGATGRTIRRFKGRERGDAFSTATGGDALPGGVDAALYGSPGADRGVGRLWAANLEPGAREFFFSVDGAAMAGGPLRRFGESLIVLGHVNGDSASHWAVGAPSTGDEDGVPPAVVMLHAPGASLVERWRMEGAPESRLGWRIVELDEVRDSFIDHWAVSAPTETVGSRKNAGVVYKIATIEGTVDWRVEGPKANFHFGYALRWASDWDGDGIRDLLVGSPHRKKGFVYLISGATGETLWRLRAPAGASRFGMSVLEHDVNGDGTRDVVVGAPSARGAAGKEAGLVLAYSGADLSLLLRREGDAAGQWLGAALAGGPDVDGDGVSELLVGSFFEDLDRPNRGAKGGVDLVDPLTGVALLEIRGRQPGDRLGWPRLTWGLDQDGDGVFDLSMSSPRGAQIFIPR